MSPKRVVIVIKDSRYSNAHPTLDPVEIEVKLPEMLERDPGVACNARNVFKFGLESTEIDFLGTSWLRRSDKTSFSTGPERANLRPTRTIIFTFDGGVLDD